MQQLPITVSDITMIKFEYNFSMHNTFNTGEMCHGTVGSHNRAFSWREFGCCPTNPTLCDGAVEIHTLFDIYIYSCLASKWS
jgi:hypothetical protein